MYTPNNVMVYDAAYVGALAGISILNRQLVFTDPAKYAAQAAVAGGYAQEFDTIWGVAPANELVLGLIQDGSESLVAERFYQDPTPSAFRDRVVALIALINAGQAYVLGQGITPPSPPTSGAFIQEDTSGVINVIAGATATTSGSPHSMALGDSAFIDVGCDNSVALSPNTAIGSGPLYASSPNSVAVISQSVCQAPNTAVLSSGGFSSFTNESVLAGYNGDQYSAVPLFGETLGLAPNESVELDFPFDHTHLRLASAYGPLLENALLVELKAVVSALITGVRYSRVFLQRYSVHFAAGPIVVIDAADPDNRSFGAAATNSFTLTASAIADRFAVTFATGGGTTARCLVDCMTHLTLV